MAMSWRDGANPSQCDQAPSGRRWPRVGAVVVTVEAMKMEHAMTAPVAGVVELLVAAGDQVKVGQPLARIVANTEDGAHE